MSHVDKMAEHLAAYEKWQATVSAIEADSLVRVRGQRVGRPVSALAASTPDAYYVAKDLEGDVWYRKAQQSRNGHQQAAIMFALAALVERGAVPAEVTR